MDKFHRNERIGVILKTLCDLPGEVFTLGFFSDLFGSAKSTISEDVDIIQNLLDKLDMGIIESIPGSLGGVRFIPRYKKQKIKGILDGLCKELSSPHRILPGGYIYMLDIIYDPHKASDIGNIFAGYFFKKAIDYVVTVETKGIPLAFSVARSLNVPLLIARRNSEAADGPSVNINYVTGSSKKIQTMVLSTRALKRNSRLLFIDDFMKGGGTAGGFVELAKEFECEVAGIGIFIERKAPERKLVDNYMSLITLNNTDEVEKSIDITPSKDWEN
ncbi:MAG: pur operon repressor [Clostridiaceae bacterium]|nr:pur operon repressor [Clostridiaceae bacterium]